MSLDFNQVALQVNPLLESARGMTLVHAQLLKEGFRFVFEDAQHRKVILLAPRVYADGIVIVDALNNLVIAVTVTTYDLEAYRRDAARAEPLNEQTYELPYSLWFFEGNYRS